MKPVGNKYGHYKKICLGFIAWAFCITAFSQCITSKFISDSLINVETGDAPIPERLKILYGLKKQFEQCKLQPDSVYAHLSHRIGSYEYSVNNEIPTAVAINYTLQALRINTSGKKNACEWFAILSYRNLGLYYHRFGLTDKALIYYDSALNLYKKFPDKSKLILDARKDKNNIFVEKADYQKCLDNSILGLQKAKEANSTSNVAIFFWMKAQAYSYQNNFSNSLADADSALHYLSVLDDPYQNANVLLVKATVFEKQKIFPDAIKCYTQAIAERLKTADSSQLAIDYKGLGDFYSVQLNDYTKAKQCYLKSISFAKPSGAIYQLARVYVDMGVLYFFQHNYKEATDYYLKTFELINCNTNGNILIAPPFEKANAVNDKEVIILLLDNTADLLLHLYKQTNDKKYLSACLRTSRLNDSVITQIRHEQTADQSKLYWRDKTREVFSYAIEAAHLDNDPATAFYFMEKSRAVLLNDKLNELGAAIHLPPDEAAKQESLQIKIIEQQQKLSSLDESSSEYNSGQLKLIAAREDFDRYIKSLEQKYPAYYQYKYADNVPSLTDLQKNLSVNKQSFIHYFIGDTVTYILAITPNGTKFIRLSQKDFTPSQLSVFLQFCASKDALNNHYSDFVTLSNSIYKTLFQSLQIPKGRVVVCMDNYLIPFEALCTDATGKNFLINDYAFSYSYSARFLMKDFSNTGASGQFLGFAPVSFASYLRLPELTNSAMALHASSVFYSGVKLLTNHDATCNAFTQQIPRYAVVNVFSHAMADSSGSEPRLFMQDSAIHLSELQLINKPATQLVVLSACQTNVGKNATGEGIYSLARGFASAGIPSVAATLWNADEETVYSISESFNRNLSIGMRKDEALQQAKLSFMRSNSGDKLLPYYWANMILAGNADVVRLSPDNHFWWWIGGAGFLIIAVSIIIWKRKKSR